MKGLEAYKEELTACVRCGTCKSVCPTFEAVTREGSSARGRLSLVRARLSAGLEPNDGYARMIKDCTLCGACMESCPNNVDTPAIMLAARVDLTESRGMGVAASFVLKNVLDSNRLGPWAMRLASRLQGLVIKRDPSVGSGFLSRFRLSVIDGITGQGSRLVPALADTFFLDSKVVKDMGKREAQKGALKVGFFAGCGINYLFPGVGEASLKALDRAGAEVGVPKAQVCCGIPALSAGDLPTARSLALKNLEVFEQEEYDRIVTACATCTYGLKTLVKTLLLDEGADGSAELNERVERFCAKVRDVTEFLATELPLPSTPNRVQGAKGKVRRSVTYHDPCHLARAQGITREPRQLIEQSGFELKEMTEPGRCCGLGGGVGFTNYELSSRVASCKAADINSTGAELVATACPGCMVQLADAIHRSGKDTRVVHVVELL